MIPDKVLANIIQNEMSLPNGRVVLYDNNFKAPKDHRLYAIISTGPDKIISNVNKFDYENNKQIQKISMNTEYIIELTSKNTDAKLRRHEILMAIVSDYAVRMMEDNNMKIFRTSRILDLSFIEGASSLHRYRISVIINHMEIKESDTDCYENFQTAEVEINE